MKCYIKKPGDKTILNGRTIGYLADKIPIHRVYLGAILNGKMHTKSVTAEAITRVLGGTDLNEYFEIR